ncbi:LPXTG cell wall anchor domain-containing protein [Streptomyces sp. NPDC055078]
MSIARRPLLTAAAAGSLLCALWFVPSANATAERGAERQHSSTGPASHELRLADTGGFDTTPYVIGGTAFLGVGAGLVTYAVRRRESLPM